MTAAKAHGIVVHGQCGDASYTRFSISSEMDLAVGAGRSVDGMQIIEGVVGIPKDHCPPQEQTIFEWFDLMRNPTDALSRLDLEINLEHHRVFKHGTEVYMSRYD